MRLIRYTPKHEAKTYDRDHIISFGKRYLSTGKYDGWYVKLELPSVKIMRGINPNTFESEDMPFRYVMYYRYRVKTELRKSISGITKGWFPTL